MSHRHLLTCCRLLHLTAQCSCFFLHSFPLPSCEACKIITYPSKFKSEDKEMFNLFLTFSAADLHWEDLQKIFPGHERFPTPDGAAGSGKMFWLYTLRRWAREIYHIMAASPHLSVLVVNNELLNCSLLLLPRSI